MGNWIRSMVGRYRQMMQDREDRQRQLEDGTFEQLKDIEEGTQEDFIKRRNEAKDELDTINHEINEVLYDDTLADDDKEFHLTDLVTRRQVLRETVKDLNGRVARFSARIQSINKVQMVQLERRSNEQFTKVAQNASHLKLADMIRDVGRAEDAIQSVYDGFDEVAEEAALAISTSSSNTAISAGEPETEAKKLVQGFNERRKANRSRRVSSPSTTTAATTNAAVPIVVAKTEQKKGPAVVAVKQQQSKAIAATSSATLAVKPTTSKPASNAVLIPVGPVQHVSIGQSSKRDASSSSASVTGRVKQQYQKLSTKEEELTEEHTEDSGVRMLA